MKFTPQGQVTQKYLENATSIYKNAGLVGHTGVDWTNGYGHAIRAGNDGIVYKVIVPGQLPDNWAAVYILSENDHDTMMEVCYGHISKSLVKVGEHVAAGQIIALEGNSGDVFYGGKRITPEMQRDGDKRGSHCHESWRPVKRRPVVKKGEHYLRRVDGSIYSTPEGVYEIIFNNEKTRGCIDPFMYSDTPEKKIALMKSVLSPLFALLNKLK